MLLASLLHFGRQVVGRMDPTSGAIMLGKLKDPVVDDLQDDLGECVLTTDGGANSGGAERAHADRQQPRDHLLLLTDRQFASRGQTNAGVVVDIRNLVPGALHAAVMLLAESMRDNPLHVKVFGLDSARRERRLRRFLGHLLTYVRSNGMLIGAYAQGELVGVLGMMQPGRCRPAGRDWLRFVRVILVGNSPQVVLRSVRWLAAWARNDPPEAHWHLGPMAVRPEFRRQGIARRLMRHGCRHIDSLGEAAFLETDLAINAAFYESLGFVVVRHETVLGVPNWFMRRSPRSDAA